MGVYFAPKQTPWWAPLLGQLASDQIEAMGERTRMGKQVEDQRAFSGFLSEFAQGNPDASREDILLAALGSPHFARSGDMGKQALETMMVERERRRAEADMMGLGEDNLSIMKPLLYGSRMGIDQKVLGDTLFPDLVQRNLNLGDRFVGQMVNPRTGKVTGDSVSENIGMDPGTLAKLAQDRDQFNAEIGLKRQIAARTGAGDQLKGWTLKQDKDGNYVYFHPALGTRPMNVTGPKPKGDGMTPADILKGMGAIDPYDPENEGLLAALRDQLLNVMSQGGTGAPSGGAPATGRAAGGGGVPERIRTLSSMPPQDVLQDPGAIQELASYMGVTEDEVRRRLQGGVGR